MYKTMAGKDIGYRKIKYNNIKSAKLHHSRAQEHVHAELVNDDKKLRSR